MSETKIEKVVLSFEDVKKSIVEKIQLTKVRGFSRSDFDALLLSFINTADYEAVDYKLKDGEKVEVKKYPVKAFREMFKSVLKDFGVDAAQSEAVLDDYKFKKKDIAGMYDFMTEYLIQYLETTRKLTFPTKESGSFSLKTVHLDEKLVKNALHGTTTKMEERDKVTASNVVAPWKKSKVD